MIDTTTFLDTMFSNSFSSFITLPTRVWNTSETLIDNIFYNKPLNNDFIAGNLCPIIYAHLIQFLVESSSYMHNSSKEKITKRCYKKFDKRKTQIWLRKSIGKSVVTTLTQMFLWNIFLKIVHPLLDIHAPFKSFNKNRTYIALNHG